AGVHVAARLLAAVVRAQSRAQLGTPRRTARSARRFVVEAAAGGVAAGLLARVVEAFAGADLGAAAAGAGGLVVEAAAGDVAAGDLARVVEPRAGADLGAAAPGARRLVVEAPPAGVIAARRLAGGGETVPGSNLGAGKSLRRPTRDWGCRAESRP